MFDLKVHVDSDYGLAVADPYFLQGTAEMVAEAVVSVRSTTTAVHESVDLRVLMPESLFLMSCSRDPQDILLKSGYVHDLNPVLF